MARRDPNATLARMARGVLLGFGARPKADELLVTLARADDAHAISALLEPATKRIARMVEAQQRRHPAATLEIPPATVALERIGVRPDASLRFADESAFERSELRAAADADHPVWNELPDAAPISAGIRWVARQCTGESSVSAPSAAVDALATAISRRRAQWRWLALERHVSAEALVHLWQPWRRFEAAQRALVELFDQGHVRIDALGLGQRVTAVLERGIAACGAGDTLAHLPSVWTLSEFRGIGEGTLGKIAAVLVARADDTWAAGARLAFDAGDGTLGEGLGDLAALFGGAE